MRRIRRITDPHQTLPAIVQTLHERPDLADLFPIATSLDESVRWSV